MSAWLEKQRARETDRRKRNFIDEHRGSGMCPIVWRMTWTPNQQIAGTFSENVYPLLGENKNNNNNKKESTFCCDVSKKVSETFFFLNHWRSYLELSEGERTHVTELFGRHSTLLLTSAKYMFKFFLYFFQYVWCLKLQNR